MTMNRTRRLIGCACLLAGLLSVSPTQAQTAAIKTNLLYDATATPNLGGEYRLSDRWTAGLAVGYNPFSFSNNKKWKHLLVSPEARYWLCSAFAGHFVGANLIYAHYNAGNVNLPFGMARPLRRERWQGDFGAIGVFYGYSWLLSNRWSIEAVGGLGYGVTHFSKYECARCGSYKGTEMRHRFMPTRLALSVVYNLW